MGERPERPRDSEMALGVTDHVWSIGELVDAALDGTLALDSPKRYGGFTVIKGGKN